MDSAQMNLLYFSDGHPYLRCISASKEQSGNKM